MDKNRQWCPYCKHPIRLFYKLPVPDPDRLLDGQLWRFQYCKTCGCEFDVLRGKLSEFTRAGNDWAVDGHIYRRLHDYFAVYPTSSYTQINDLFEVDDD